MGNWFCRVANVPDRKNIYLYLTESPDSGHGHFDVIGKHECETTCDVCCSDKCRLSDRQMSCRLCRHLCRNLACFQRHAARKEKRGKDTEKSMCEKIYKCTSYSKVFETAIRRPTDQFSFEWKCPNCQEYQLGQDLCYQR